MNKRWQFVAARFALLYAVLAGIWIAGSDFVLGSLSKSMTDYTALSMAKGFAFVLVTSAILFLTLRRLLRTEFEARRRAEETAQRLSEVVGEREQVAGALRESEQRYRAVFDAANDGIMLLDGGRFVDCNERASTLFHCTRNELLGRSPADLSPQRQPDGRLSAEEETLNNQRALAGEPRFFQWQHQRPDGTTFTAEVSLRRCTVGAQNLLLALVRDITERIQTEEALRESEEKLRALYTSMNEGLALHEIVVDAAGQPVDYRVLDVNPAYETITGLKREAVIGKLASLVYGTDSPPYLEIYAQVAVSGEPTTFETYFGHFGKHFAVSIFSPRKGQFATVFADITKRKDAENQLSLLSHVYALISNISQAIVRTSNRETLLREACRIAVEHGQLRLAWIGLLDEAAREIQPMSSAGHEGGYLARLKTAGELSLEGQGPAAIAARSGRVVISPDLEHESAPVAWREAALELGFKASIALPLVTHGRTIGVFCVYAAQPEYFNVIVAESLIEVAADLSFALDLFERNRQREIEQRQLRLQHSALEAAANAIVITNRHGEIEWVNAAFTRLTGYAREEAVGCNPRVLKSGAHDQEFYRRMWQTVTAGAVWQGALTNKRKDGTPYHEEMTITPVRSESGEIGHFVAIKQDVTERRKLEQQFLRAQRMQSIGLLAGGVAHDLNNVLAPVLLALPLLRDNLGSEQRDSILETLEQSVQRGANIVQQVLTYARGVEVQSVLVQLRHLVREVTRIAEETFPRDIRINASVPAGLWPLQGDPTQIHQVLLNLAVNARDAMPDGGELSFIGRNVELREPLAFLDFEIPPGRYVSVNVSDTGTGIAPEVLERMFEPFFTTKPTGKGTGLGLSTVLGIVKSHGGLVEVETNIGAGSRFTVFLPAAAPDAVPATPEQRPSFPQGQGETILVVDDEAAILRVTRSTLESNGYRVLTARDGAEGMEKFSQHAGTIKAVLTDIMMPVMDGLAMAGSMRKLDARIPVIASTGLMNPPGEGDRASQLRESGVKHFLRKPFQAEELLTTLAEALHP